MLNKIKHTSLDPDTGFEYAVATFPTNIKQLKKMDSHQLVAILAPATIWFRDWESS
jgi:hypothetical protein